MSRSVAWMNSASVSRSWPSPHSTSSHARIEPGCAGNHQLTNYIGLFLMYSNLVWQFYLKLQTPP